MSLSRINQANGRLKSSKVGVQIQAQGDRLYLRATLPSKSGDKPAHQQRIALGVMANPAGVSFAEKEARKVGLMLAENTFTWDKYQKQSRPDQVSDWIERFEAHYFKTRERNDKTLTTWKGDYLKILKLLPQEQPLTVEALRAVIDSTPLNSKTRKRACMVASALAKFAELPLDVQGLGGNYSPKRTSPREIPEDALIAECWEKLSNPAWRWVYGMLATYGLRPHEVFRLNLDAIRSGSLVLEVQENTKTGFRRVWPCYPEWFEQFNLSQVILPPVDASRSNTRVGESCTKYLSEKLPFKPYDLRHAWAIRTLSFGLDITLAAQQMGHSVQTHSETYHHWISDQVHQRAFETLMLRPDRPLPPILHFE
ncbi:site-specific integrase [Thermosynechococcaceae cyanobacterium BACA0444]|uniref:Site-specific integrase n=1 Tax=Pseudocalidococcus azoricus BACA0444 TaxID=2918990 RepID=A0AAE4JYB1_9CYAN|nr:site-specific integrase [Pseudocalidococcus azoricus]MDS3862003.1 site-specific integrase [Pseudocalidococcus azoricus BACA0444]